MIISGPGNLVLTTTAGQPLPASYQFSYTTVAVGFFQTQLTWELGNLACQKAVTVTVEPSCTAGCNGDPHFKTWRGERYDYMGECSLELASDPTFAGGKGLDVHIRTAIRRNWSYIKSAAIRIGNDILEVMGGADGNHYWFNKKHQGELSTIGGFLVSYKKANSKSRSYTIDLGGNKENKIEIRTYKDFVRVNFQNPSKELYGNTVGLLGDFATGKKLARDGVTEITDVNEFGQEWQVKLDAPMLFNEVSGPQTPFKKCMLPNKNSQAEEKRHRHQRHRRLGQVEAKDEFVEEFTELQAKAACEKAGVSKDELAACIYDVLATDDTDMAGSY